MDWYFSKFSKFLDVVVEDDAEVYYKVNIDAFSLELLRAHDSSLNVEYFTKVLLVRMCLI